MAHTNCIVCGEDHGTDRKLSWDGQGINSCGIYRDRIAKLGASYLHLGNKMARAINSHDALVAALEKSIRHIEQVCSTANTLSNQLGLGYKVHAPDFTESARAALALAKGE